MAVGWADSTAHDVQGSVLLLLLLNFSLTLPGRAPTLPSAIASAAGLPLAYAIQTHAFNTGTLVGIIPALIGAAAGSTVGGFLDAASSQSVERAAPRDRRWHERPLSLRFVLGIVLVGLAVAGIWPVRTTLMAIGHPAAGFATLVWSTLTLIGWAALAPGILRERARIAHDESARGLTAADAVTHVAIVLALCTLHAALITVATAALLLPIRPGWLGMARAAFGSFLPLDAAAYLAILALGSASDVERKRHVASARSRPRSYAP